MNQFSKQDIMDLINDAWAEGELEYLRDCVQRLQTCLVMLLSVLQDEKILYPEDLEVILTTITVRGE